MAVLEIKKYPSPVLKGRAKPVKEFTQELQTLIDDMIETMYAAPGVGLAAPQVGIPLRLAVVDVGPEDDRQLMVLVNPELVSCEGEEDDNEGCLSVTDYTSSVKRYSKVKVRALDRKGKPIEVTGEGFLARALQHELDHLDGMLFIDRISPLKRDLFKRKVKKSLKKEGPEAT